MFVIVIVITVVFVIDRELSATNAELRSTIQQLELKLLECASIGKAKSRGNHNNNSNNKSILLLIMIIIIYKQHYSQ